MTDSFLIAITVLLIVSLIVMGKARVRYLDRIKFYLVNDDFEAPSATIPLLCYLPILLTSVLEMVWVIGNWPECYIALDRATPSFSDSNWIWTAFMCFVVPLPCGAQTFLIVQQFKSVEPLKDSLRYPLIIVSSAGLLCLFVMMVKVYPLWFIWWPIASGALYFRIMWPKTDIEKKYEDEKRREREEKRATTPYTSPSCSPTSSSSQPRNRNTSSRSQSTSSSTSSDNSNNEREAVIRQQADNYLYQARQYEDEARRLESEAESNDRWADDNEYWARESNDSFKRSEAEADRRRASSLRYQASNARRNAERYYSLYNSEMSKLR